MDDTRIRRQRAFEALEHATEVPMLILSLALIPLLIVPWAFDLGDDAEATIVAIDWIVWALFALELSAKTYLSPHRAGYLREHWFDLLIVLLPMLRPLRIARSARAVRLLRLARVLAFSARYVHTARTLADSHGLKYVILLAALLTAGSAGLVTVFEMDRGGPIANYEEGLWWAFTTVTTVGYGDRYPITPEGRAVAIFLMVIGITLFSVLTANIAAFLVKAPASEPTLGEVMAKLAVIEARLAALQPTAETGAGQRDEQTETAGDRPSPYPVSLAGRGD
jgi:voltage-gated potassium channel